MLAAAPAEPCLATLAEIGHLSSRHLAEPAQPSSDAVKVCGDVLPGTTDYWLNLNADTRHRGCVQQLDKSLSVRGANYVLYAEALRLRLLSEMLGISVHTTVSCSERGREKTVFTFYPASKAVQMC